MNPYKYLRDNGIKHAWEVIYQYKIDLVLQLALQPFYKKRELKNIILIESHNDFDCNGGAFYEYLIENQYNKKYKIVWLLKHPEKMPGCLPKNVECYPLYKPSIKKNYYIWNAKFFVADNSVTTKKKSNQKSFYLTHGVGSLKSVKGKMYIDDTVDYVLTASKNYAPIMARQISMDYPNNKFISIGFPVHDYMYKKLWDEIDKVTTRKYKNVLLWMPTFRKGGGYKRIDSTLEMELGIPLIHTLEEYKALNHYLHENDAVLIIKIHPMQDLKDLLIEDLSNIIVLIGDTVKEKGIDNYRLLTNVDALISDYSSIATEFLHVNRPIAYVFEDEKQFKAGFCVDNIDDLLAGPKLNTVNDLYSFIEDVIGKQDTYKEARAKMRVWMFDYLDDNSCKRLVDFMEL